MSNRGRLLAVAVALATAGAVGEAQCKLAPARGAPISNKAPSAGQVLKEKPPPAVPDEQTYRFTVNTFKVTDTRSPHSDKDYIAIAVASPGSHGSTAQLLSIDQVNNGVYQVNRSVTVSVKRDQKVAFSYIIINSGADLVLLDAALPPLAGKAASDAAERSEKALPAFVEITPKTANHVGQRAGGWVSGFNAQGIIPFFNCDGSVAAGDHVFTGAGLAWRTSRGRVFSATDDNQGTDSPLGCGSNSRYYVTWSIAGPAQGSSPSRGNVSRSHGTVTSRHQLPN